MQTPTGLNDLGAWCGYRFTCWPEEGEATGYRPLYCPPGGMPQVLPMPPGASAGGAQATAVNNSGVVVGFKYVGASDQYQQGVIWWPDGSVETIPPAKGASTSRANDINDSGVIVGSSGGLPYVLKDGMMTLLDPSPLLSGSARGITDSGLVVGDLGSADLGGRGFLWNGGSVQLLPPAGTHTGSLAYDANNQGWAVGFSRSTISGVIHQSPTLWIDGSPIELPPPPGYARGWAFRINDAGVITGGFASEPPLPAVTVIWFQGEVFILKDLIVGGAPSVGEIWGINESGQLLSRGGPRLLSPTWSSPMDLNGDCAVNGNDLGVLLASWGAPDFDARCDFNGDGIVDGHDLGTLLGAWTIHW